MQKKILKFVIVFLTGSLLTSCALSNSIEKINYQPAYTVNNTVTSASSIKLEPMKDERGYTDEKVIFYKKNMYNQTMSGAYMAEEPIPQLLTKAINSGLVKKGITVNAEGKSKTLKSTLQKFDYEAVSGFSSAQIIPQIMVKFQLYDENNKVIWTDILVGKANTKGTNFSKFLPPAIDNLVVQLINNESFLQALEGSQE
ncbi:YajG family lipoprotein [Epilithonimonas mollis]|uniref:DUF4136 domain-containing protein n=1 Tax=Epilithonimonas mollis TaxID=216903 RepID=A0A1M6RSG6_9FLAO|nr:hypothetical protein [Epilithonimonas mollis]SHK35441.1 hypothetical protein SAMN05444371_2056 [Epilithonimonas mollis]